MIEFRPRSSSVISHYCGRARSRAKGPCFGVIIVLLGALLPTPSYVAAQDAYDIRYFLQAVLGSTSHEDWRDRPVERWATKNVSVMVSSMDRDRLVGVLSFVLDSALSTDNGLRFTIAGVPANYDRAGMYLIVGAEREREAFRRAVAEQSDRSETKPSRDLEVNIALADGLECRTVVFVAGSDIVKSFTFISQTLPHKAQVYCSFLSILVGAGFKGRAITIDSCESLLCSHRHTAVPTQADAISLSLLYGKTIKTGMSGEDAAYAARFELGQ